ncbi:ComEC/Rec2-related protein [Serinicoccus hydrothermalis]|uniref:ComEC/Rec2-related protein n=1 Tax=Serinicoccus hydrothermalis TaxID=1758689 RepID=A0A1B1NAB2_9MICO|nr:ComEC/Rec2 family competence protein [Serinicoccus hydrothermalis]ANS78369.1 ComEC/Rec2-related protein [Serinicoccus hydrothermalis]
MRGGRTDGAPERAAETEPASGPETEPEPDSEPGPESGPEPETEPEPDSELDPEPPHDLRLLLPALAAWAVLVAVLVGPRWVPPLVAVVSLVAALLLGLLAGRPSGRTGRRPSGWRQQLALSAAAIALVVGATSLHTAVARAGPVAGWAQDRAVTTARVLVTTEPRLIARADERDPLVVLEGRVVQASARGETTRPATPVVVMATAGQGWTDGAVAWRSVVEVSGRWGPGRPGERAVAVLVQRGPPTVVSPPPALLRGVDHVRASFREAVDPLPTDARGLVPGLVIGDSSLTPPDLTQAMRDTGMTHLSAVSGSNVAIVVGGVALLVVRAGLPRRWRLPVVLAGLVCFVLLCRPEPSVLRAGVMGAIALVALAGGRRRTSLPLLGGAVLVLLCLDPWLARSYGFALSTLATLGLVLWARPWGLAMAAVLPGWAGLAARAAAVPLAAQVICAPVIVLLQGDITTVAVLANLLAAPLVPPTTILGLLAAVLAPVSTVLGSAVAWAAAVPAWAIGRIARVCARAPLGSLEWWDGALGAWALAVLTVLLLVTGRRWLRLGRRRPWAAVALAAVVLASALPVPGLRGWPPPGWVVAGCDVGQGDAFVVRTAPGHALLVDTGPDPTAVRTCLHDLEVGTVDLLVLTHFHTDHVAGLPGVLGGTQVEQVLVTPVRDPPEVAAATLGLLAAEGIPVHQARVGDRWDVGAARATVLWPSATPPVAGSAANNASIVLDVDVGGTALLLTGDLEPESARQVRESTQGRDYDVLKVAHHGSAAQDERLVLGADPEVALIGVGADNDFGHPSPSALSLLSQAGAVVLRTDLHGDVAVVRDTRSRLVPHARE